MNALRVVAIVGNDELERAAMSPAHTLFWLLLGSILSASPAAAATVESASGQVLSNHGQGFKSTAAGAVLRVGEQVLVRAGGHATIRYDDGCRVVVTEDAMHQVQGRAGGVKDDVAEASPCAAGQPTTYSSSIATEIGPGLVSASTAAVGAGIAFDGKSRKSTGPASP